MSELNEELEKLVAEQEEELHDYYGIEQEPEKKKRRPGTKIVPEEQEKARSLRMKRYKEQNMARFSNIYMLAGILIGVAVFYFLVAPDLKDDYNEKIRELETSYNETISTKNNEIDNLNLELQSISSKNSELESRQTDMQTTIDNLTEEVETLKRTVESGGLSTAQVDYTPAEGLEGEDGTNAIDDAEKKLLEDQEAAKNAAADRNNANVIGISGQSVEDMIDNE